MFSPSKIDKAVERLEDYYGKDGYLETRVHVTRRPNLKTNDIDLEFKVDESDKYNVESIEIEGNTKTKSVVIIRELVLGPGDVFDTVRMKISKNRLENTRFFDEVDITPQDTNIPGRKDMRVSVKEGRTGTFTFGAGYSTLERATVFAQIQQTNFDLFNRRSLFQGDGEKFSIKVSIGELSNEAVISFEEPYLFEKQLALGFSVFREQSDYVSTYYQELSEGGNVSLRKQLFGLFSGTVTYQYETVSIYDVSPSASDIITEFSGVHRISDVSFELVRDTRDKIVSPTSGNRVDLIATVAGGPLGGTDSYLQPGIQGVPELQGVRHPDPDPRAGRKVGRHPELRGLSVDTLLRFVLPGRALRPPRIRVPRGQPARSVWRADRRQDLRHVQRRVLGRNRRPDPVCRFL